MTLNKNERIFFHVLDSSILAFPSLRGLIGLGEGVYLT